MALAKINRRSIKTKIIHCNIQYLDLLELLINISSSFVFNYFNIKCL